jgi:hypothetical protein
MDLFEYQGKHAAGATWLIPLTRQETTTLACAIRWGRARCAELGE